MKPNLFIIGGANGAGKTTVAMTLLAQYLEVFEFVNADEIARGLNPLRPATANIMAGRVMIDRLNNLIQAQANLAFETTCAGNRHVETIIKAKSAGYLITLMFFWLPSADMAVQRVRARVAQGGHDIPEATIRRRYTAGIKNLRELFMPLADKVVIYDSANAIIGGVLPKIAEKIGDSLVVLNPDLWQQLNSSIKE